MAADLTIVTPGALKSSLVVLLPRFEEAGGARAGFTLCPALAVPKRLGEASFDLAIMGAKAARELAAAGRLSGVKVIARSGVGAFVRRGDPKPQISDARSFLAALRNAKVITYSDPALGGSASNYVHGLLQALDTQGDIAPKIRLAKEYRSIANIVAAGGVDIALNQVTEIMADPRLELVAPLPAEHQRYTDYAIGVVAGGARADEAAALIEFLRTPESVAVMRANGFEPDGEARA